MSLALARTVAARKGAKSYGRCILPWVPGRRLDSTPPGIFGCMSADGVYHATYQLREDWERARALLGERQEWRDTVEDAKNALTGASAGALEIMKAIREELS